MVRRRCSASALPATVASAGLPKRRRDSLARRLRPEGRPRRSPGSQSTRGGRKRHVGAAQRGGAARVSITSRCARRSDPAGPPSAGREAAGKFFRMQGRNRLLDEAGRTGKWASRHDLRQSVAHMGRIRRNSTIFPGYVQFLPERSTSLPTSNAIQGDGAKCSGRRTWCHQSPALRRDCSRSPGVALFGGRPAQAQTSVKIGYAISRTGPNAGGAAVTTIPNYDLWVRK